MSEPRPFKGGQSTERFNATGLTGCTPKRANSRQECAIRVQGTVNDVKERFDRRAMLRCAWCGLTPEGSSRAPSDNLTRQTMGSFTIVLICLLVPLMEMVVSK